MKQLALVLLVLVLVAWFGTSGYTVVLVNDTGDLMTTHVAVSDDSHAWTMDVAPRSAMVIGFTPTRDSHLVVDATVGDTTIRSNTGYFEPGHSGGTVCYRVGADLHPVRCSLPYR